jgi:hypothetical protein
MSDFQISGASRASSAGAQTNSNEATPRKASKDNIGELLNGACQEGSTTTTWALMLERALQNNGKGIKS